MRNKGITIGIRVYSVNMRVVVGKDYPLLSLECRCLKKL